MINHRHRFKINSWGKDGVTFRCACGQACSRKMDKEELRRYKETSMLRPKPKDDIHRVYHEFRSRFKTRTGVWKWSGFDLMQRVEKWAKMHPGDVRIVGCDDNHFSGSDLVLIEHRTDARYMGTTVIFISQCRGDLPAELFLYPGHRQALLDALVEIGRETKPRQKRQRKAQIENTRWWNSRAKPRKTK